MHDGVLVNEPKFRIRAAFLDRPGCRSCRRKGHLTTRQAGHFARESGTKLVIPFHFSSRCADREAQLRAEFNASCLGRTPLSTATVQMEQRKDFERFYHHHGIGYSC